MSEKLFLNNLKSIEDKEKFLEQIKKNISSNELPMVYMNNEGWLVEEWSDGRIEKLKKIK